MWSVQTEVAVLLYIILLTKKLCVKFEILKAWSSVITENNIFRGVIPCGVEIMGSVSEDCQYISTEWNGVTSQKTPFFIAHRENLISHIAITECDIKLEQLLTSRPSRQ